MYIHLLLKMIKMQKFELVISLLLCYLISTRWCYSQINFSYDFESGSTNLCQCPPDFTCFNDAGRVIDGIQPIYVVGDLGCVGIGPLAVNHTNSIGAHGGSGYVYFYAGADQLRTSSIWFNANEQVELSIWYCGPQDSGDIHQNTSLAHFSFGVDGIQVSPNVTVPTNTLWTKYTYLLTLSSGFHNLSILSGGIGKYAMWFDDFTISTCLNYTFDVGYDTSICKNESLQISLPNSDFTYQWDDGTTNSEYEVNQPGTYWVNALLGNCTYSDTFFVKQLDLDYQIEMPNIFTPNFDGINNLFHPLVLSGIVESNITIVNRWGNVMWKTDNILIGWDGMCDEKECSEGVYFWTIRFKDKCGTEHEKHGFLTLIR